MATGRRAAQEGNLELRSSLLREGASTVSNHIPLFLGCAPLYLFASYSWSSVLKTLSPKRCLCCGPCQPSRDLSGSEGTTLFLRQASSSCVCPFPAPSVPSLSVSLIPIPSTCLEQKDTQATQTSLISSGERSVILD